MSNPIPVLIEWEDAYHEGGGVWDSDTQEPPECIVCQVGFLIYQDDRRIALTSGIASDGQPQARFVIPVGMIRSVVELKTGRKLKLP